MKKYAFILLSGLTAALLLGVLGIGSAMLSAPGAGGGRADEEGWIMVDSNVRDADALANLAGSFRQSFSWLPDGPSEAELAAQNAAVNAAPPPPPPPPKWRFVGVLLEDSAEAQFALVAEAGRVNKYRVGDAFLDGTTLVDVREQSMRISKAGEEREVFLYQRQ